MGTSWEVGVREVSSLFGKFWEGAGSIHGSPPHWISHLPITLPARTARPTVVHTNLMQIYPPLPSALQPPEEWEISLLGSLPSLISEL